jgi:hypothetical protein
MQTSIEDKSSACAAAILHMQQALTLLDTIDGFDIPASHLDLAIATSRERLIEMQSPADASEPRYIPRGARIRVGTSGTA